MRSFIYFKLKFQSALAMVGGLVTPPLLLGGPAGANLGSETQQYLVSACLIWCGIGTALQVSRFKIGKTGYYYGTGLISVTGTSFAFTNVALSYLNQSVSFPTTTFAFYRIERRKTILYKSLPESDSTRTVPAQWPPTV